MKKAKIMLSAITVLAIVGGALAFTAKKTQTTIYTLHGTNNTCTTGSLFNTASSGLTISATTTDKAACTTITLGE